jgi:archaellum component FlaC
MPSLEKNIRELDNLLENIKNKIYHIVDFYNVNMEESIKARRDLYYAIENDLGRYYAKR